MKKLFAILLLFIGYEAVSQTFLPPRSSSTTTVQDSRWRALLTMYYPHTHGLTLNGGLDTLGAVLYDDSSAHVWYRDTVLAGGHKWSMILKSGDAGQGTLTQLNTGLGLLGGPVTTAGTLIVDTSYGNGLSHFFIRIKDSTVAFVTPTQMNAQGFLKTVNGIALGGDMTGSALPNPVIAANAVTFGKFQTIPGQTFVANPTASPAVTQASYFKYGLIWNNDSLKVDTATLKAVFAGGTVVGGINQLTGDGTAGPGNGSQSFTLATVNANTGGFGSASSVATFTVNGKGLLTAAASTAIQISESQVTGLTTDLSNKLATALASGAIFVGNGTNLAAAITPSGDWTINNAGVATLKNTGSGAGSCLNCNITFDAQGREVSWANGSGGTGGTNSNTGSGYRFAIPNTNNIKTFFVVGGTLDSTTNANAITLTVTGGSGGSLVNLGAGHRMGFPNTNNLRTLFCAGCTLDSTTNANALTITVSGSVTPTFQQTLTQGNALTKADTINQAGNNFTFTGGGRVIFDSVFLKSFSASVFSSSTSLVAAGDSYPAGSNRSNPDTPFVPRIGAIYSIPITNYSVPSSGIWRADSVLYNHINTTSPNANYAGSTVVMAGLNDYRRSTNYMLTTRKVANGYNAIFLNNYISTVYSGTTTSTANFTETGSGWADGAYVASSLGGKENNGSFTNHSGDFWQFAFTGTSVGFGTIGTDSSLGVANYTESMQIFIDGSLIKTASLDNQTDGISDGVYDNTRTPMVFFFTGLSAGSHTIKVVNNTAHAYYMPIDYVCTLIDPAVTATRPLIIYEIPHLTATGYATSPNNANQTIINNANNSLDSTIALWPAGYSVFVIKTNTYFGNSPSDYNPADSLHPSNLGDFKLANAVVVTLPRNTTAAPGSLFNIAGFPNFVDTNGVNRVLAYAYNTLHDSTKFIYASPGTQQTAFFNISGTGTGGKFVTTGSSMSGTATDLDAPFVAGTNVSGIPFASWRNTANSSDAKIFDFLNSGDEFVGRLVKDDNSSANFWLQVNRSGITPTGVLLFEPLTISAASPGTSIRMTAYANNNTMVISSPTPITGFFKPFNTNVFATAGIQYFQSDSSTASAAFSNIYLASSGSSLSGSSSIQFANNNTSRSVSFGQDNSNGHWLITYGVFGGDQSGTKLIYGDSLGKIFIPQTQDSVATPNGGYLFRNSATGEIELGPPGSGGGAQTLTATQLATTINIAISGGNNQNLLTATTSLAGLLDTARARFIDSLRTGLKVFNLYAANGLTATAGDSFYLGGALNQNTTIGTSGFTLSFTGLPNKATALSTDSVLLINTAGQLFKLPVPSGGGSITLTTTGTSGASTLTGTTLNIPQYQGVITLTTTGSSGAATFTSGTLNIPQYTGGGTPGGSNTQVQFNNSGAFGGSSSLTWNGTTLATTAFSASSTVNLTGLTNTTGGASFKVVAEDTSTGKLWNIPYFPVDTTGFSSTDSLVYFNGAKFILRLAPSSGTWTPTITTGTNVSAGTGNVCTYSRIGNIVSFAGTINATITVAATASVINISLPVSSTFTAITDANGTVGANSALSLNPLNLIANTSSTHTITINFGSGASTGGYILFFSGQYIIK